MFRIVDPYPWGYAWATCQLSARKGTRLRGEPAGGRHSELTSARGDNDDDGNNHDDAHEDAPRERRSNRKVRFVNLEECHLWRSVNTSTSGRRR